MRNSLLFLLAFLFSCQARESRRLKQDHDHIERCSTSTLLATSPRSTIYIHAASSSTTSCSGESARIQSTTSPSQSPTLSSSTSAATNTYRARLKTTCSSASSKAASVSSPSQRTTHKSSLTTSIPRSSSIASLLSSTLAYHYTSSSALRSQSSRPSSSSGKPAVSISSALSASPSVASLPSISQSSSQRSQTLFTATQGLSRQSSRLSSSSSTNTKLSASSTILGFSLTSSSASRLSSPPQSSSQFSQTTITTSFRSSSISSVQFITQSSISLRILSSLSSTSSVTTHTSVSQSSGQSSPTTVTTSFQPSRQSSQSSVSVSLASLSISRPFSSTSSATLQTSVLQSIQPSQTGFITLSPTSCYSPPSAIPTLISWPVTISNASTNDTLTFYSDPNQGDFVDYFGISVNGTNADLDTSDLNMPVIVTENGTYVFDYTSGFVNFFSTDCTTEVQMPFSYFNTSQSSSPARVRRSPPAPVGTPIAVLFTSITDACGNPIDQIPPPTVPQLIGTANTDCTTCVATPQKGPGVCTSTCVYPAPETACFNALQQLVQDHVMKPSTQMSLTLGGICSLLHFTHGVPSNVPPAVKALSVVCTVLGGINTGLQTSPNICSYLGLLPDLFYELEVRENYGAGAGVHLLAQIQPPTAGEIFGPYPIQLKTLSPVYWTSPSQNLLANPAFDDYLCTSLSTSLPWTPSSFGLDTVNYLGNGVWINTGGEDGKLGCASGQPSDNCV